MSHGASQSSDMGMGYLRLGDLVIGLDLEKVTPLRSPGCACSCSDPFSYLLLCGCLSVLAA